LNADGSLDPTFTMTLPTNAWIRSMILEARGNVLVQYVDGGAPGTFIRLQPNGTRDPGFHPPANSGSVLMAVQRDGSVLIYGWLSVTNDQPRNRLVRLRSDGSVDPVFNVVVDLVSSLVCRPDGRILIGGYFSSVNGVAREGIAQLNADGSLDTTFELDTTRTHSSLLVLQPDGKVLMAGSSYSSDGFRDGIFRFNPDGSLDRSFQTGPFTIPYCGPLYPPGCQYAFSVVAVQPDGKVVVVGNFSAVTGVSRPGIARLNSDGRYVRISSLTPMTDGSVRVTINGQPGKSYLLQGSTDLRQWMDLRREPAGGYTLTLDDSAAAAFSQRFYRVVLLTP
jgi:uncharacterized delta-60 repeat protein